MPGLTVLVGCNGAGKSTLLYNIEEELKNQEIPVYRFDNLKHSVSDNMSVAMYDGDMEMMAAYSRASEGEAIKLNILQIAHGVNAFLEKGTSPEKKGKLYEGLRKALFPDSADAVSSSSLRCLLFDATDSGFSVDNIIELKEFFDLMEEKAEEKGMELYIIISANEYELARGERCMDVNTGKVLSFPDYEAYRKHVLESRERKNKRLEKMPD